MQLLQLAEVSDLNDLVLIYEINVFLAHSFKFKKTI